MKLITKELLKERLRVVIGCAMMVAGVLLGLYIGLWVCFIGGIVDIVNAVNAGRGGAPLDGIAIGVGVLKTISASFVGVVSALALIFPGSKIAFDTSSKKRTNGYVRW